MGKLTSEVFNESCCDGGAGCNAMSAQPCGCDPGANYKCKIHSETPHESTEVRITDPITGGEKGSKLQRYDLIPAEFLFALATHYGKGARKYDDRNWEKGYKWGLSYAALMRHLEAWRMGEDKDPETGSHHLVAAAWHCIALFIFQFRGLGTDDLRSK